MGSVSGHGRDGLSVSLEHLAACLQKGGGKTFELFLRDSWGSVTIGKLRQKPVDNCWHGRVDRCRSVREKEGFQVGFDSKVGWVLSELE